jgi:hypothetical protein
MGLMVEATDISTRGVIKREDLPGRRWFFENGRFTGPGGRKIELGHRLKMVVARIDHERRFVDFRLAGEGGSDAPVRRGARKNSKPATGKSERNPSTAKRAKKLPHQRRRKKG